MLAFAFDPGRQRHKHPGRGFNEGDGTVVHLTAHGDGRITADHSSFQVRHFRQHTMGRGFDFAFQVRPTAVTIQVQMHGFHFRFLLSDSYFRFLWLSSAVRTSGAMRQARANHAVLSGRLGGCVTLPVGNTHFAASIACHVVIL
jgi:hypothetical protein